MDDHGGRFRSVDPADEAKTQLSNAKALLRPVITIIMGSKSALSK